MSEKQEVSAYRLAYPELLEQAEKACVTISRQGRSARTPSTSPLTAPASENVGPVGPGGPGGPAEAEAAETAEAAEAADFGIADCTGIGLSGGGIRSATFCLGVFQGLARLGVLRRLDFLSTVSGGGYFGSFYTRFLLRQQVDDFALVEEALAPGSHSDSKLSGGLRAYLRNVVAWLRENGRYLAPRGSGDLLLAGAVLLRNWLVVQIVLAFFLMLIFLSAQALRLQLSFGWSPLQLDLDGWFHQLGFLKHPNSELVFNLPGKLQLWISPFIVIPEFILLIGAVPFGWAYWIVGRHSQVGKASDFYKHPLAGVLFVMAVAVGGLFCGEPCRAAAVGVLLAIGITLLSAFVSWRAGGPATGKGATKEEYQDVFRDELARSLVSSQLKAALVLAGAVLAFVAVDSLGQTVYLVLLTPGATLKSWGAGLLAVIVGLSPFTHKFLIILRGTDGAKRPKGSSRLAAGAAAFVVIATLLTTYSVAANALAWNLKRPTYGPAGIGSKTAWTLSDAEIVADPGQPNQWRLKADVFLPQTEWAELRDGRLLGTGWALALVLSWLFGQSWPFLNRSTQLPLYSARLIRAYLGASNPRRAAGSAVTCVIEGDDSELEYYWPWPPPAGSRPVNSQSRQQRTETIYRHGTPLHLINVTINETLDGKSQVQQQDRKGIGLALGPAGMSAGVRHHAVFDESGGLRVFPLRGFKVFGRDRAEFGGERLPVGQWLSISGAAFSTGLGARTSLALSLLTGIGNVRLGYWWNSGVLPTIREEMLCGGVSRKLGAIFTRIFPVQSYLLDEFTARYHGTARREWYLTDGGHFENMGGYELIRRRLRLIIIIDAEADPDYNFGGLADLIRKARIDFCADIRFLENDRLNEVLGGGHCFSTLENLRRGKWVEEKTPVLNQQEGMRRLIDPVDYGRFSLAHAAIATVTYDCASKPSSCLIYLKPTLLGQEPLDVLQYHVDNPTFPQQTTTDQFFDEAQWESYRRLGEHTAGRVFRPQEEVGAAEWLDSVVKKVLGE